MRQWGSEAPKLDAAAMQYTYAPDFDATDFVALEGGRLDAKAREGMSAPATRIIAYVVAFVIMIVLSGGLSVALTAKTVSILQSNTSVSAQITETQSENSDLRIARSLLSRSERISRIATQNLGMVYANDATRLSLT